MLRVVKVRLYPNRSQEQAIHRTFGSCRFVYNILLDAKIKAYECRDNLSAYELKKRLVPMKKAQGGEFLKVDPKYTSQKCSCCGHISKENRQTQAKFICTKCYTELNADYNASVNILNAVGTTVKAS